MGQHLKAASLRGATLVFLVAVVMLATAGAEEAEGQGGALRLTLQQTVEMALEKNLDMKVAWEDIEAARQRRGIRQNGPDR